MLDGKKWRERQNPVRVRRRIGLVYRELNVRRTDLVETARRSAFAVPTGPICWVT